MQITCAPVVSSRARGGASNVNFIGDPTCDSGNASGNCDSGAIRIHNSSSSAVSIDDVTVTIGSSVFDLWGSGRNVPAGGDLILAQTNGQNFDTSDANGQLFNCTPSGVIPAVAITLGGVV